ncbi:hypothetical protein DV737_g1944, partial [Chaetothyriales sp. CBS 132003]
MVHIAQFEVAAWSDERHATHDLASTASAPMSIQDLIDLSEHKDQTVQALKLNDILLDYNSPTAGGHVLRDALAGLYSARGSSVQSKHILITHAAIDANYIVLAALLSPGDHVICHYPTFEQLYQVPKSLGADVTLWKTDPSNKWLLDVDELKRLVRPKTKMIIINNPHNPSGAVATKSTLEDIIQVAAEKDIIVLSDEAFRPVFHSILPSDDDFPPSAINLGYSKTIVTSTMSKAYGLPGIRVGWIASQDSDLLQLCQRMRRYTSTTVSQLDETVAAEALSDRCIHAILAKNIRFCVANVEQWQTFIDQHNWACQWVRPTAGTTAMIRFHKMGKPVDDEKLCVQLEEKAAVKLVPGCVCFGERRDFKGYVRVGLGVDPDKVKAGLAALAKFLEDEAFHASQRARELDAQHSTVGHVAPNVAPNVAPDVAPDAADAPSESSAGVHADAILNYWRKRFHPQTVTWAKLAQVNHENTDLAEERVQVHGYITKRRIGGKTITFGRLIDPSMSMSLQMIHSIPKPPSTEEPIAQARDKDSTNEGTISILPDPPGQTTASSDEKPATSGQHAATPEMMDKVRQVMRDLRPHTPVVVYGRIVRRKDDTSPAVQSQPDGFVGNTDSFNNIELDVESLYPLNDFPLHLVAKQDTSFPPEQRNLQFRTDRRLRDRIRLRSRVMALARRGLFRLGFDEIETPLLFKSTPEGAREFIVPTRDRGMAYALPQSPQQYKQLLMASGFAHYFQFAKCFRDEDNRADRQPEFTQLDIEMAFANSFTVMSTVEQLLLQEILPYLDISSLHYQKQHSQLVRVGRRRSMPLTMPDTLRIKTLSYNRAMTLYGSDKPDERIGAKFHRVEAYLPASLKGMLTSLQDPVIEMFKLRMHGTHPDASRSFVAKFMQLPTSQRFSQNPDGMPGITVFDPTKPLEGLASFGHDAAEKVVADLSPESGDILVLQSRPDKPFSGGSTPLGDMRVEIHSAAVDEGLIKPPTGFSLLWINEFPLFTRIDASELVFTTTRDLTAMVNDPLSAVGDHFDLVINGTEVGGGSCRIHDAKMQEIILKDILKMPTQRVEAFRHLLDALATGCPPHAGFAFGFDRLMAVITNKKSVRDVIAFPKDGHGQDRFVKSPLPLTQEQLQTYHLAISDAAELDTREMRERICALVGCELEKKLVLGTFHSICRRYLAAYGHLIGIPPGFSIADSSDSMSMVKKIVKQHAFTVDPKIIRARISSHKAKGISADLLPKGPQNQLAMREFIVVYHRYQEALAASNLLDYDDLLLRCLDLLRSHPHCVSNVEALLIDEFQDTNLVQFELMKCFASAKRQVTVVGDPDQSIYGFRSAEIENLKRMKAHYPETVIIHLEQNYRSCSSILNLAQDVIEQDTERPEKKLKSTHCYGTLPVLRKLPNPHEEAMWIAAEIKRITLSTGGLLQKSDFAVLLRSAHLSLLIEKALTGAGIAYRMVGGMRFFDRVEIRLIVDYLRTISHPENDQSFLSIINVPSRKIGDATITALVEIGRRNTISLWSVVQKVLAGQLTPAKAMSASSQHDLRKLVSLIKIARQKMKTMTAAEVPAKLIEYVVSSLDLQAYLQRKYKEDYEDRLENIRELMSHAEDLKLKRLEKRVTLPE